MFWMYIYIYIYISKNILAIIFVLHGISYLHSNQPSWQSLGIIPFVHVFCALASTTGGPRPNDVGWSPSGILPVSEATSIAVSTGQKDSRVTSRCEVLVGKCFITSQIGRLEQIAILSRTRGFFLYSQFQHAIFCLSVKCKAYLYISFVLS